MTTAAAFARHELRLAWREWLSLMTAGKRSREALALAVGALFLAGLLAMAYALVAAPLRTGVTTTPATLVLFTGLLGLSASLMLAQSIESVTRVFYARADLDLILSSPANAATLFAVRVLAIVLSSALMALGLAAPFALVAAVIDGPRWFAVIPTIFALAALSTSLAMVVTVGLFRVVGARRTRLIAQVVAAMVGAAFLIGLQIAAILSFGELSRFSMLTSSVLITSAPAPCSVVWLPARAALGDPAALVALVAASLAVLAMAVAFVAPRFADVATRAASISEHDEARGRTGTIDAGHPDAALGAKEWRLIARDPWLVSQTLMQVLYLVPPALLLWQSYGESTGALVVLAPVLVMAVGQLAGGLAWLAISGEDAPDLVATAPILPRAVTIAKVRSVLTIVLAVVAPFLVGLTLADAWVGAVTAVAVLVSAVSAVAIQLWFRTQARRSAFRRRQTASRVATFAEAFSSISWAGAAALGAAQHWAALVFVLLAMSVLAVARALKA